MRHQHRALIALAFVALILSSCVIERIPDTPGNAAIQLTGFLRRGEVAEIGPLLCAEITEVADSDLENPSTLGAMADFNEARMRNISEARTAFGGESQYSTAEEVNLAADEAWTEIEFVGEDLTEVWRLHMVREEGKWKACDAELRP